jgi:hypothetical protein
MSRQIHEHFDFQILANGYSGDLSSSASCFPSRLINPTACDKLRDIGESGTLLWTIETMDISNRKRISTTIRFPLSFASYWLCSYGWYLAGQSGLTSSITTLQIAPDDASTHNNLGIALMSEEKPEEATREFQEALYLARGQNNIDLENSIRKRLDAIRQKSQ